MRGVGDLPNVNEMTTERVGGSYNVNVDIKLASLRNDYAFNDFLQEIWVPKFDPRVLIIETLSLIL